MKLMSKKTKQTPSDSLMLLVWQDQPFGHQGLRLRTADRFLAATGSKIVRRKETDDIAQRCLCPCFIPDWTGARVIPPRRQGRR